LTGHLHRARARSAGFWPKLGYLYFDTGVMYRRRHSLWVGYPVEDEDAVTRLAQEVVIEPRPPDVEDGRDVTVLADGVDITPSLRLPKVERAVSDLRLRRQARHG
jgi:cytidylate kinase